MKKLMLIMTLLMVGVLVFSGIGTAAVTSGVTSHKQMQSQKLENKENPQFPTIIVHVTEVYGTLDNPQYRPLANVTVRIQEIPSWMDYWRGKTDDNGRTEEVIVEWGYLYKVIVSKYKYHPTYGCLSYTGVGILEIRRYDVYFTMAKDGSPFVQQISQNIQQQKVSLLPSIY